MGKDDPKDQLTKLDSLGRKIPVYRESRRFDDWCKLFNDETKKEFYGKPTACAMKAYHLTKDQGSSASQIGHENLLKLKHLASIYAEKKNLGYFDMINIAMVKMADAKDPAWWDRLMKLFGYANFIDTKQTKIQVGIVFDKKEYGY